MKSHDAMHIIIDLAAPHCVTSDELEALLKIRKLHGAAKAAADMAESYYSRVKSRATSIVRVTDILGKTELVELPADTGG